MSIVDGKTYYCSNDPLTLDIRPLEQEEWSKFDGNPFECFNCKFKWFYIVVSIPNGNCPKCNSKNIDWIVNAGDMIVFE